MKSGGYRLGVLLSFILLIGIGLLAIFSASFVETGGHADYGFNYAYFVSRQFVALGVGLVAFALGRKLRLRSLQPLLGTPFLAMVWVLLILVLVSGVEINGASRWLFLGGLQFQPSELAKLAMIFFAANFFARNPKAAGNWTRCLPFFVALFGTVILVEREPDLGTAVIIGLLGWSIWFINGAKLTTWAGTTTVLGLLVMLVTWATPYRWARVLAAYDPFAFREDGGYQAVQSLLALGRGGLTGVGLGRSVQKFKYLPEAHTDYIFAIVGEETGWVGSVFVLALFGLMMWNGFRIAQACHRPFERSVAFGVTFMLSIQTILNVLVVTSTFPSTGIPLPFLSYGGTSLVLCCGCVGVLLQVGDLVRKEYKQEQSRKKLRERQKDRQLREQPRLDLMDNKEAWSNRVALKRYTKVQTKIPKHQVYKPDVKKQNKRRRSNDS